MTSQCWIDNAGEIQAFVPAPTPDDMITYHLVSPTGCLGYYTPPSASLPEVAGPGDQCTEDMDCWDCHTTGDHQCGNVYGRTPEIPTVSTMPEMPTTSTTVPPDHPDSLPVTGLDVFGMVGMATALIVGGRRLVKWTNA